MSFIIVFGLLLRFSNDNQKRRLTYIFWCCFVLILVAALRSADWMTYKYGLDTSSYRDDFDTVFNYSWDDVKNTVFQRYLGNQGDYDIGFVVLLKIIRFFTDSFYVFSVIADLLFFIPFGLILYHFGTNLRQLIFAFVFYVALIQVFFLGGARQMFAVGFDLMAFLSIIDRKKWLSLIFFLCGLTIHFSSLSFIVPLLLIWFDVKPKALKVIHTLCFISFPIVLLFPQQIIILMGEAVGMEKYSNYGLADMQGGATTFIILIELLSLFCLFFIKKQDLEDRPHLRHLYVMAPLFTLLAPLIHADGAMIRVSLYYHLFLSLLVPYGIECGFKKETQTLFYFLVILGLVSLSLSGGGIEYYFFWQR